MTSHNTSPMTTSQTTLKVSSQPIESLHSHTPPPPIDIEIDFLRNSQTDIADDEFKAILDTMETSPQRSFNILNNSLIKVSTITFGPLIVKGCRIEW